MHRLSLVVGSGDYSLVAVQGLFIVVASLVVEHRPQQLWYMGSVVATPRF